MKKCNLVIIILLILTSISRAQEVKSIDAVGITVLDINRALDFFTKVLPFTKVSEVEVYGPEYEKLKGIFGTRYKKVRLRLGQEEIELTDYTTAGGRSIPEGLRSNDLSFQHIAIVVSNMDSAYARLLKYNVQHVSTAPQTLPKSIPAAQGIKAFYFRDPAGHNLELIYYPPGKGDPKWQNKTNQLFLGIDHTAIAVSKTSKSRIFYESLLNLKLLGESLNEGNEQAHLNYVENARVQISGYKAINGIGLEFLEYLQPTNGKPYPPDARPDDLIHYETIFIASDIEALYKKFQDNKVVILSKGIAEFPKSSYGYSKGFYARDPDGHVIGIFER